MASVESIERVTLKTKPERWNKYRLALRSEITKGVQRLRQLRSAILGRARVSELPPVEVVDIGWTAPRELTPIGQTIIVHGCSTIFDTPIGKELGARIAAPAVIHCSDAELVGVLLHEFCHCFFHARQVIRSGMEGRLYSFNGDQRQVYDVDYDKSCLDPPELWFSESDVQVFPYQHDKLLSASLATIAREWVAKKLPMTVPGVVKVGSEVQIPGAIARHVRSTM